MGAANQTEESEVRELSGKESGTVILDSFPESSHTSVSSAWFAGATFDYKKQWELTCHVRISVRNPIFRCLPSRVRKESKSRILDSLTKSAQGILLPGTRIYGRILGNEFWTPEFWTRIVGTNFLILFFSSKRGPWKIHLREIRLPKFTFQNSTQKSGNKNSHCTPAGPFAWDSLRDSFEIPSLFHWEIKGRFRKRVVLANVPSFRFSFRGNIRRNHPFGNHPFGNPPKGSLGDKRAVSKRVVLANVPSFRFSFRGNIRQNYPFGNHPFRFPRLLGVERNQRRKKHTLFFFAGGIFVVMCLFSPIMNDPKRPTFMLHICQCTFFYVWLHTPCLAPAQGSAPCGNLEQIVCWHFRHALWNEWPKDT